MSRMRVAVAALTLSAAAVAGWQVKEGFTARPVIPVQGDVPTIGHGTTRYEDGTPVRMSDPPITRERAAQLARHLLREDERRLAESLPGVRLYQEEFDLYVDWVGQYGIGRWRSSSIRRHLLAGRYREACDALLAYRFMTGAAPKPGWHPYQFDAQGRPTRWRYDCATRENGAPNHKCWGVWTRQQERHAKCLAAQ